MTTPILHTPECRKETIQREQAHAAYVERWPLACDACLATGRHDYPGSLYEPPSEDTCDACDGRCPRCGFRYQEDPSNESDAYVEFIEGMAVCPSCAYDLRNPDVMPPHPSEYGPCECEDAAMLATLEEN